jgi:hypothetical protein
MNLRATTSEREQMREVLSSALREIHGAGVSLEDWTAHPVSKRGRHRVVRYASPASCRTLPPCGAASWKHTSAGQRPMRN